MLIAIGACDMQVTPLRILLCRALTYRKATQSAGRNRAVRCQVAHNPCYRLTHMHAHRIANACVHI